MRDERALLRAPSQAGIRAGDSLGIAFPRVLRSGMVALTGAFCMKKDQ
jgi:hypothetical protein